MTVFDFPLRQHEAFPAKIAGKLPPLLERALVGWKASLEEPYRGISVGGAIEQGLYRFVADQPPCRNLVAAATNLLNQLNDKQRRQISFPLECKEWRSWSNVHPYVMRHGVCLDDLVPSQRDDIFTLMQQVLSPEGFETARGIMKLSEYNRQITRRPEEYGEYLYWFSLMGEPSEHEPWGWQIDGHHLIVNCLVIGGQIVLAPVFMGAEPVKASGGQYAGLRVLQEEETAGLLVMRSLTPEQRQSAIIAPEPPADVVAGAFADNVELPIQGVRFSDLSVQQQTLLRALIDIYLRRMPAAQASAKRSEVEEHIASTYFCWMGGFGDDDPFYYRAFNAVLLIEFGHLSGLVFDNPQPTRNHIHTVIRTPNGNDYGKALLLNYRKQRGLRP